MEGAETQKMWMRTMLKESEGIGNLVGARGWRVMDSNLTRVMFRRILEVEA